MEKKVRNIFRRLVLFLNKAKYSSDMSLYIQIDNLASCLFYLGYLTFDEYNSMFDKLTKICEEYRNLAKQVTKANINDILSCNDTLIKIYWNLYNQYNSQNVYYTDNSISGENINLAIDDFFSMLNCKNLYDELNSTGKIIRFDSVNEESFCIDDNGSSYLLLHNHPINNAKYYTCLIHEMGHAYVNHVLKHRASLHESNIFCEIISVLFERLFHQFLYENNYISKDEYERIILNFDASCRSKLKLGIISSEIVESGKFTLKGLKVIPETSWEINKRLKTILTGVNIDCTSWLSLKWTYYILADIVSRKLFFEYQKDRTNFILNLPPLVKELSSLNLNEIMDKYNVIS